jgi:hypothetical protein
MRLQAPNGEVAEVPDDQVQHYVSMGAKVLPNVDPRAGARFSGTDEPGGMDPGLLDPMNLIPVPGAQIGPGLAAGRVASRGLSGAASRIPIGRAIETGADIASGGKTALLRAFGRFGRGAPDPPANIPMPPGAVAVPAPGIVGAPAAQWSTTVAGAVPEAIEEVGSAVSRTIPKGKQLVREYIRSAPKKAKGKAPKGKVVGKIEPKVGSAESRVARGESAVQRAKRIEPSQKAPRRSQAMNESLTAEVPGQLEAQIRMSQKVNAELDRMGVTDPTTRAEIFRQLSAGGF